MRDDSAADVVNEGHEAADRLRLECTRHGRGTIPFLLDWSSPRLKPTLITSTKDIGPPGRDAPHVAQRAPTPDGCGAQIGAAPPQPGLWFGTGFIRMARFHSKFTATLIKAIDERIEPVARTE
jgi:hypothetical protein